MFAHGGGGGGSVWAGEHGASYSEKIPSSTQDKASGISGKEQLQWTVFTARYLLGQVKASSV